MRLVPRLCVFLAVVGLGAPAVVHAQTPESQDAQVMAVAHAFGDALARGDSIAALALLHADVLILEGRATETKEQYRSGHLAADIRYAQSVKRELIREGVTLMGDSALFTRQQRTTGTSSRGAPIDRTTTEALVLVRTADGWRIRSIHWF